MVRGIKKMALVSSGAAVAIGITLFSSPAAFADSHTYTHPTTGVTCDQWRHILLNGDPTYEGRCTGKPVGFSAEYKYREGQECDYSGAPAWVYGSWRSDGGWSAPPTCPGGSGIIAHKLQFQWV
jgi:hypothetical protein